MLNIDSKTFNPEILYVFDSEMIGPRSGKNHYHDFFEISIILEGQSEYTIEGETRLLEKGAILLFNPGVYHYEQIPKGMHNRQIHIGIRHFSIDRFPRDFFPLEATIVHLSEYEDVFFETCFEIIKERNERKSGYDIILKSLVLKLMVYILRDKSTDQLEDKELVLTDEELERQQLVDGIKLYIETNYREDLTLNRIAEACYASPATISRIFKDQLGESPINYLIRYRLEKAKTLLDNTEDISIKETAHLIGYEDALYFSKLFKKYYGSSPTDYAKRNK
ncbi:MULTISPECIES: helix-turn-helix domain-containing protein [unclassified Jeotgalibaca]|uniref:helix-turn-helix domain-containing protein n=1 Tax=unclassified Jeotgalibaca TaxID=2621505 RepID=UPI003FD075BF